MSIYDDAIQLMIESIEEFGREIKLLTEIKIVGDNPLDKSFNYDSEPIKAIFTLAEQELIGGARGVRRDDWLDMYDKACICDNRLPITKKNLIEDNGFRYKIVKVQEIKPGDSLIGYRIFLKGA